MEDSKYVYHGSPTNSFEIVKPKRNIRTQLSKRTHKEEILFDQVSFHATPYRWIAVAYTYHGNIPFEIDGKMAHYNIGVSLYTNTRKLTIYGFKSLENSLERLYGKGGYLYIFDEKDFVHGKGLGNLEVITKDTVSPLSIEKIDNPIKELKKMKVDFEFIDLSEPKNVEFRNYY